MGFSERVTALRKQAGWSQEELAQRLDVSRQAVSKWESGQAMPDLDRVVRMSELFGVSTDSLLKDTPEPDRSVQEAVRAVTMEEAEAFLSLKETMADRIAWAVLACVLAPIPLLMLSALAEAGRLSENVAGAVGIAALLVLAAGAVAVFMSCGTASERYEYLEKEPIQAARSVIQMAREQQESSRERYGRWNVVGVSLCILAALPLLIAAMLAASQFVRFGIPGWQLAERDRGEEGQPVVLSEARNGDMAFFLRRAPACATPTMKTSLGWTSAITFGPAAPAMRRPGCMWCSTGRHCWWFR